MRIWHKNLISVLPNQQLFDQWRDCCFIATNINSCDTIIDIFINRILDYNLSHFYKYCCLIASEMATRGYKATDYSIDAVFNSFDKDTRMTSEYITIDELFASWHDNRYLTQCYYNLQEKYDCGAITYLDWQKIDSFYTTEVNDKLIISGKTEI